MEVERVGMILFRAIDLCSDDAKCIFEDIKTCKGWGLLCSLDKIKLKKTLIENKEIDYLKNIGYKMGGLVYIGEDDCDNTYIIRITYYGYDSKVNFEIEVNQVYGDIAKKLMESGADIETEHISEVIIYLTRIYYKNVVSRGFCQSSG